MLQGHYPFRTKNIWVPALHVSVCVSPRGELDVLNGPRANVIFVSGCGESLCHEFHNSDDDDEDESFYPTSV